MNQYNEISTLQELKPIVDNPAGFMHNYMARKPYNVVSEIIKRFCPDNGCVYDPMFGSGTISFFIAEKKGPQFGFFGDAWQTIYQSNKACGLIENENLEIIKKGSNFRSAPRIVRLLNDLRPDLPQTSAIDGFDGEVIVITCDDYTGPRRTERNLKGELPAEELKNRLNNVTEKIKRESSKEDDLKVLMITHKVLATQQGYEQLLEILDDGLRDKEDPFLLFFMDTVEPIYQALKDSNMQLLFDTLGIKRFPIKKKSEKVKWKELQQQLEIARTKRAIDVFELIKRTKLIPIPPKLDGWYHLYQKAPETVYVSNTSIQSFLELDYLQFIAAIDFLFPDAMFSTEHGVKGEEYDNVVFVISKGWNLYQFETYAPMITGHVNVPEGKQTSVYKGYKQDKIEMRGDRAEMSDFPLYLNTVAGGLDRRDQTIGGFSFVVKIYAVPVVEIIG